jgi:hypothetical protein
MWSKTRQTPKFGVSILIQKGSIFQNLHMRPFRFGTASKMTLDNADDYYGGLGTLLTIAGALSFIAALFSCFHPRMTIASNFLIFDGVYLILGPHKFRKFILTPYRAIGTAIFVIGLVLIIFRIVWWGGILELVGLFTVFGCFLPHLIRFLQTLPIIGGFFRFAIPRRFYRATDEDLPL